MTTLRQLPNASAYYMGWYGTCENTGVEQCSSFDLVTTTGTTFAHAYDTIENVFIVSSNREGYISYAGGVPSMFLRFAQVKQLECGKCYQIVLKPGTGSIDIPEFTFANAQNDDQDQDLNNRVTNKCFAPPPPPQPSATPTSTPIPVSATPTSTPAVTPTNTPTPTTTPVVDKCEGFNHGTPVGSVEVIHEQVRFTAFPDGGHICFAGATGGPPNNSMIRIDGLPIPEGRMVVNGLLLNNDIKYINAEGKIYLGTFANNGPFTDLTLQ